MGRCGATPESRGADCSRHPDGAQSPGGTDTDHPLASLPLPAPIWGYRFQQGTLLDPVRLQLPLPSHLPSALPSSIAYINVTHSITPLMELLICVLMSILSLPLSNLLIFLTRILLRRLAPPLIELHAGTDFPRPMAGSTIRGSGGGDEDDLRRSTSVPPVARVVDLLPCGVNLSVARYRRPSDEASAAAADCVVCLSGIEEGEEIRELRCRHLFHRRCLDRWLALRRPATCPLCRDALVPAEPVAAKGGDAADEEELGESAAVLLFAYVQWWMW
ncbi:hypothetical protein Cni_G25152 [Canna indica]|uniref:RING-type domain-containing protein n=1 Tax=Canna indica TaxID=4628 RepID=A0AAQ3QQ89_9LILI|nr:hypothetical protein Cni_G25152 [Canna indica]